jgi:hypothetical protein
MESKYYTPTIEEFHVGFEYEFREGAQWIKLKYNPAHGLVGRVLEDLVRVKYLDKEDIESLDYTLVSYDKDVELIFKKGENSLYYSIKSKQLSIYEVDCDWDSRMFMGIIKNKSELITLIRQLDIQKGL